MAKGRWVGGCLVASLICGSLIVVGLFVAAMSYVGLFGTKSSVEANRRELKEMGLPSKGEELAVTDINPDEDAGPVLDRMRKYSSNLDQNLVEDMDMAFMGLGFDNERAKELLRDHPNYFSMAEEAASKPKVDLKFEWTPPRSDGTSLRASALCDAAQALVVRALAAVVAGRMDQAVKDLGLADHLAQIALPQAYFTYERKPDMALRFVDQAVMYMAEREAGRPESLRQLLEFASKPRPGLNVSEVFGASTIAEFEDYAHASYRSTKDPVAKVLAPDSITQARATVKSAMTRRVVVWAKDVKRRLGGHDSPTDWKRALDEAQSNFPKAGSSGNGLLDYTAQMHFPMVSEDLDEVARPAARKKLTEAYVRVILYHATQGRWPRDLSEAGIAGHDSFFYSPKANGFEVWILSVNHPITDLHNENQVSDSYPQSRYDSRSYFPAPR